MARASVQKYQECISELNTFISEASAEVENLSSAAEDCVDNMGEEDPAASGASAKVKDIVKKIQEAIDEVKDVCQKLQEELDNIKAIDVNFD